MPAPASGDRSGASLFGDLAGKVAVVTGGARGLGLAMARALVGQGMRAALLDLLPEVERSAATLHADSGGEVVGLVADVTSPESVDAAFGQVADRWGTPQVLVNAAGIAATRPAEDLDLAFWRQAMDVNVVGTLVPCQRFAHGAFAAGVPGSIVNVSSMSAFVVNVPQRQAAYNASKAAVDHLTRSLAVEWVGRGVRVNAIAPGYFLTDMTRGAVEDEPAWARQWLAHIPAGRMGEPDDLAGLVVYLASDASRYVVGATIVIDGGYSVV
jgi:NAD(P)-dependent dehydrogenase (short-subunit alcohol dehydrogenase family)